MHATRFSVGNVTPVQLELTDPDGGKCYIRNDGATDVFVGGANVDTAGTLGFRVPATTTLPFAIEYSPGETPLYCIGAAAGPVNVYVLQSGEHP